MSTVLGIIMLGGLLAFAVYMSIGIYKDIKQKRANKKDKEDKP